MNGRHCHSPPIEYSLPYGRGGRLTSQQGGPQDSPWHWPHFYGESSRGLEGRRRGPLCRKWQGSACGRTSQHSSPGRKGAWYPWNFTLPRKVPPDPAKPTPALSGEQAAFKEFETPWSLAGSGGGPTQPLGQEITFLHRRRTSQVSNPSGQLISLRGRAPPSTGSETPRLGFSQARPSEGMGVTALTCRPGVSWQKAPARARAGGCAKVGSGLTRRGWDEVLQE